MRGLRRTEFEGYQALTVEQAPWSSSRSGRGMRAEPGSHTQGTYQLGQTLPRIDLHPANAHRAAIGATHDPYSGDLSGGSTNSPIKRNTREVKTRGRSSNGGAKGIRTPDPHTASVKKDVLACVRTSTGYPNIHVRQLDSYSSV